MQSIPRVWHGSQLPPVMMLGSARLLQQRRWRTQRRQTAHLQAQAQQRVAFHSQTSLLVCCVACQQQHAACVTNMSAACGGRGRGVARGSSHDSDRVCGVWMYVHDKPITSTVPPPPPPTHTHTHTLAGPPLPLLSRLGTLPLSLGAPGWTPPLGWELHTEPLATWALVNPPFISEDCRLNPDGRLCSGAVSMLRVARSPGLAGRLHALRLQSALAAGLPVDNAVQRDEVGQCT
jgi:hypothetical protein